MGHKKLDTENPSVNYPHFLKLVSNNNPRHDSKYEPILIDMSAPQAIKDLEKLIDSVPIYHLVDNYGEQYSELLLSKNAQLYRANYSIQVASIKDLLAEHYGNKPQWQMGSWIYYPWSGNLVHVLNQKDFEELRTIRNRDLITMSEQQKLLEFEVACFGMSVGSASALALGISGISRRIKLIDGAVISGSNLNRIMTGIESVGKRKEEVISNKLYEMNPYAQVKQYEKVNSSNLTTILDKPWIVKLIVDEIDDIEMKVRIRAEARKQKIPVIMATELGDTIMLDVERFDIEPERPLFHGLVPNLEEPDNLKIENQREWMKYAVKIIDPNNMPMKMQESLLKIGTTVVTHPQLGSTVMMTGGVIAFAAKNIALGNQLRSGRYLISLEDQLLADHKKRSHRRAHKKHTRIINRAISSM